MESVQWAVAEKIIQGKGFNLLDLQAGVKRCECAEILQRFISINKRLYVNNSRITIRGLLEHIIETSPYTAGTVTT